MLLKDQVCVVVGTGSPRGIGYATAQLFAEHGAKIVAADLVMHDGLVQELTTSIEMKTGMAADVLGVRCDMASYEACEALMAEALARHGRIDCLVNSAGVVETRELLSISEVDFNRMVDVNLKGAFNLCRTALEIFDRQKSGVIVNIASTAAQNGGGLVGGAHYAASKGGVISLTRAIAREFGHTGIRANVICPAMIETAMLDGLPSEKYQKIVEGIPLRRVGRNGELASACLFLASSLSSFVTGATIDVNGGSHIH